MLHVADETIGCRGGEGERIPPEVPLEGDDREGAHTSPDHAERRLSPRQTGVEEAETGNHKQYHGRSHDDEGLISRLKPLVDVGGGCKQ